MVFGSISRLNYLTALIFFLVQNQLWTVSNGLQCYSCWRFRCEDTLDSCKEMRFFPYANNQTREMTSNWRESPECPLDSDDLTLPKSYIQNCTEDENACGSYFIKLTAAIARNSINETEYPILVTPNYYYSTITALGCIKVGKSAEQENGTLSNTATTRTNNTTTPSSSTESTAVMNATTTNLQPASANSTNTTTTATKIKSIELDTNPNVTKIINEDITNKTNEEVTVHMNSSASPSMTESEKETEDLLSVAPPLSLPLTSLHDDSHPPHGPHHDDGNDDHHEYGSVAKSPVVPLRSNAPHPNATQTCNMTFSHEENRTSYGTLERINMTAVYTVCSSCNSSLCNSVYPKDDSAHIPSSSSSSSSSSSPSSTLPPPTSISSSASSLSSYHFYHRSSLHGVIVVLAHLVALTLVLGVAL